MHCGLASAGITCIDCTHTALLIDCTHTVLILYSYCTPTVLILYSYCTHTVLILYSYCTPTVLILYSYCTPTVLILYSYCTHTHTVLLLYSYCTPAVLILYSYPYCTHTVLTLYSYCTPTVLILYALAALKDFNFLGGMDKALFAEVRECIVDMVLATDMATHSEHLGELEHKVSKGSTVLVRVVLCSICALYSPYSLLYTHHFTGGTRAGFRRLLRSQNSTDGGTARS
jgi:hypothetical protein